MRSNTFRRVICLIMVALTLCLLCGTAYAAPESAKPIAAASDFAGGTGTVSDPYRIETAEQLALLSLLFSSDGVNADKYRDGHFVLTKDILLNDVSNVANWSMQPPEYAWTPIGTRRAFNGTFDGQGHTIRGMYVVSEADNAGLFSSIADAFVRNVTLTDAYLRIGTAVHDAGGIAGFAIDSEITGCSVDARIDSANCSSLGGVVGWAQTGSLRDCSFEGTIRLTEGGMRCTTTGGVAGYASNQSLVGCVNRGTIAETIAEKNDCPTVGGVVGSLDAGVSRKMENCINEGTVNVSAMYVGGVIGHLTMQRVLDLQLHSESKLYKSAITIKNCINRGIVIGQNASGTGGVIGDVHNSGSDTETLSVEGCVNSGRVTGAENVGGIVGECAAGFVKWSLCDCENTGSVSGAATVGGIVGFVNPAHTPSEVVNCRNSGSVSATDAPAGGIVGQYFGFTVLTKKADRAPFTVANCVNTGTVTTQSGIMGTGGIMGSLYTDSETERVYLRSCLNEGTVLGVKSVIAGGIVGNGETVVGGHYEIRDCANTGSIQQGDGKHAFAHNCGLNSTVDDETFESYHPDDVAMLMLSCTSLGGIIGKSKKGIVENCVNTGTLSADTDYGYMLTVADLIDMSVNYEEIPYTGYLFAGSICGLYFYVEDSAGYTPETSCIRNCSYVDAHPQGTLLLPPGTGVGQTTLSNIRPVGTTEGEALIAQLFPAR